MNHPQSISGCCHCGAVSWTHQGIPESATACHCTVCRRYGVLWAYGYEGENIVVSVRAKRMCAVIKLSDFIFAPIVAVFHFGDP